MPKPVNAIRMSVLDEDWKSVRVAAINAGVPAQTYAGALLATIDDRALEDGHGLGAVSRQERRAVWVAVPERARPRLNDLRERLGLTWACLLHEVAA